MAIQTIGLGTVADDGTGDTLRIAGDKINDNFNEVYTTLGDGSTLTAPAPTASPTFTGTITGVTADLSGDVAIGGDISADHDGAVFNFGADSEVNFTHVHDTGILLNSTNVIQFNDATQNIGAPNGTTLDINATDAIELNATLVDINANLDVSGSTTSASFVVANGGNIGSASDTDAMSISSGGVVTFSAGLVVADGGKIGSASDADSITIASAGAVTFSQTSVHSASLSVKNGATSAGFIEFFEDSDNGTNKVTLIGPASTSDVTLTLPASTDTLAVSGDITALAIALG